MNANLSLRAHPRPSQPSHAIILAALFWLATYVIFSIRSELRFDGTSTLVNGHRMVATFVGASAFWLVIANFKKLTAPSSRSPFLVIGAILPASLAVLGAMALADLLWPAEALPLNRYARWVLVWAGYFAAGVSLYVGRQIYRCLRAAGPISREISLADRPASVVAMPPREATASARSLDAPAPAEAWEWLADAMAEELAAAPEIDREALVRRLVAKAGYRLADDSLVPGHNARIDLVERIVSRLN